MFTTIFKIFNPYSGIEWAEKLLEVEYQKEYKMLKENGVKINPLVAYNFLKSIGGIKL